MTVGELKKILESYDDENIVGIENGNYVYEAEQESFETEFPGLLLRANPYKNRKLD